MINNRIKLLLAFLFWAYASQLSAQFNPPNPDEPNMKYKVTLAVEPAGVAETSGEGVYANGDDVWISTSANNPNYVFDYWDKNGVFYDTLQSTHFVIAGDNVRFTAHYKYAPVNPNEPESRYLRRIYLKSLPEGVAQFSRISGEKSEVGSLYDVRAYGDTGYVFLGWYLDTVLICKTVDLSYIVPDYNVTLTARFKYDPGNPQDPIPFIIGDANGSGMVNVADITTVVSHIFGNTPAFFKPQAADVNSSGTINVADIAGIVNLIYGLPVQQGASRRSSVQLGNNAVDVSFSPIDQNKEGVITVDVRNTSDISAVEMNLRLPEGLKVIDAEMDNERGGDRQFRYGYVDGGFKLMAYSANNKPLNGNAGKLFSIRVKLPDDIQQSSLEISLDDIVFSGRGDEIGLQLVKSNWNVEEGTVTQVVEPDVVTETRYYDLLGREVSVKNMEKSPYIIREYRDGKVVRTYKAVR
jgi:uncharacterized repeat protein (TIGR02543 family)